LPAALLSRFDMVFLLLDTVDCDKDFSWEFWGDNKLGGLDAKKCWPSFLNKDESHWMVQLYKKTGTNV